MTTRDSTRPRHPPDPIQPTNPPDTGEPSDPPAHTKAFSGMKLCLNNVAQGRYDLRWEDRPEGLSHNITWDSTVFIDNQVQGRGRGPNKIEAQDQAAYNALTAFFIPRWYPGNTYRYLNMTMKVYQRLVDMGQQGAIQWEPERNQLTDVVSQININGISQGLGIGPNIFCSRDMAAYYALGN